jgi:biopolymer transport protein TolR
MKVSHKKELDFELNLLPVISILAVCISFLLLSAVWMNTGTFDVSQALGTDAQKDGAKEKPTLWITLSNGGSVQLVVKNAPELRDSLQMNRLRGQNNHVNLSALASVIEKIKTSSPAMNTALVIPASLTPYEDLIAMMDQLKKQNVADIGIAPL